MKLMVIVLFWIGITTALAADHVIVVSIDGGRPDILLEAKTPVLFSLIQEGASTLMAQTINQSETLPAHTSMWTGVDTDTHGVTWNDDKAGHPAMVRLTVFDVLKAAGKTSAMIVGKNKLQILNHPGSVGTFMMKDTGRDVVDAFTKAFTADSLPSLVFLHFNDMDIAGHRFKWESKEQVAAAGSIDEALGTLKKWIMANDQLKKSTVLIVNADHGGHEYSHGSTMPVDKTIPWIAWGYEIQKKYSIRAPVSVMDTGATALWLLHVNVPNDWKGKPVFEILEKSKVTTSPTQ